MKTNTTDRERIAARIFDHYEHAKEKHPHFADMLFDRIAIAHADETLALFREELRRNEKRDISADDILECEIAEIAEAYADGRNSDAIEECYDAIAVLLRMADMIASEDGDCGC